MTEISYEEVIEAYFECRKNKRNTYDALKFEVNYELECLKLCREINERTYEISKSIAFIVQKPKIREVFAACFRDRIVHHLIVRRLEPLFEIEFIPDSYNCRKGKGTLYGIKRLGSKVKDFTDNYTKPCYIAKFDLQGFFMSIHKPTLYKMLEKFIYEKYKGDDIETLLYLIKKVVLHNPELCCVKKSSPKLWNKLPKNKSLFTVGKDYGLPIGNLTSQMFANFYLNEFDHIMMRKFKGFYGRYVDDFHVEVSKKEDILNCIVGMRKWLKKTLCVNLHPKKFYLQYYTKGCKFTGAVIKGNLTYIANSTISNFINVIHRYNKMAEKNPEYVKENIDNFLASINSYLGFMRQHNSYGLRRKLIKSISPLWWKAFYIKGHFEVAVCKKKYNKLYQLKGKLIKNTYYDKNN